MNNKICFIDIDGCYNHDKWYHSIDYYNNNFKDADIDPKVVKMMNQITNELGIKLVVSSSWKIDDHYFERLDRAGLENIIGRTPNLIFTVPYYEFCKGLEIKAWLGVHNVDKYLILDDESDAVLDEQRQNFLLIDARVGITKENVEYIKQWFK